MSIALPDNTTSKLTRLQQFAKRYVWSRSPGWFDHVVSPHVGQVFSIGIAHGSSPLNLAANVCNPVLTRDDVTDVPAAFVADPFMLRANGVWYMFFEVLSRIVHRGEIALATSTDGLRWHYDRVVLKENFHLAYPHVFTADGAVYLLPDTPGHGVALYKADDFPYRWRRHRTLIDDGLFFDSTIFAWHGRWWLFTAWAPRRDHPKSLRLFWSEHLDGAWMEHAASPIVSNDDRRARPCGRIQVLDGCPVRFAQDCLEEYGRAINAFRIEQLSTTGYREEELAGNPVLSAGSEHWNSGGMHHLDAHRVDDGSWIACVDGWYRTE